MAYVLVCALSRIGLALTQFAAASCATIRLKLLKIGAIVRISVRRIKLAMPSASIRRRPCRTAPRRGRLMALIPARLVDRDKTGLGGCRR